MTAEAYWSRERVRELDRRAVQQYGMSSLVLMENAGRGCADTLCRLGVAGPVVVCCGPGNNGGDGFVLARHLDLRGVLVRVLLACEPSRLQGDAAANYRILVKAGLPLAAAADVDPRRELEGAAWIVDALLGTGARGEPREMVAELIRMANDAPAHRLAVDIPSGLDCDTGRPAAATFRADHTCTFVAMKQGFAAAEAKPYLGQIHVLDIGAPRKLVEQLSRDG